jgi:hypothetical protein
MSRHTRRSHVLPATTLMLSRLPPALLLARGSRQRLAASSRCAWCSRSQARMRAVARRPCRRPAGSKNSPSRWRFRPPNLLAFRFRVRPPGSTSTYSRSVLGARATLDRRIGGFKGGPAREMTQFARSLIHDAVVGHCALCSEENRGPQPVRGRHSRWRFGGRARRSGESIPAGGGRSRPFEREQAHFAR